MKIQTLRAAVEDVLPVLDDNLARVRTEWKNGIISRHAFDAVESRYQAAKMLINGARLDPEHAYQVFSLLTIDIRDAAMESESDSSDDQILDAWLHTYREAGFTEMHPFLDVPVRPHMNLQ